MSDSIDRQETARTEARYDRIASIYDWMEVFPERRFAPMRQKVWSQIEDGEVLEVGVGTGKNFAYHRPEIRVTGIDLSDRMLQHARRKANQIGRSIELRQMDAQDLDFPDNRFDAAVATFVFCSVPEPVRGLRELGRVVKPEGKIFLLEHVRINRPEAVGQVMDLLDPLVARLMGPHINRRTEENVRQAGLKVEGVEYLAPLGLIKLIVALPASGERANRQ